MLFRQIILTTAIVLSSMAHAQSHSLGGPSAEPSIADTAPGIAANAPINRTISPVGGRGVAAGGAQGAQQQGRGAAAAGGGAGGGGGGGGGGATYKHSEIADKSMEYGKQARESIQKGLDKFGEGVKSLADGFKESLAAVSKLPEDNQEIMKDLRKNVESIVKRSADPIGAEAVAKYTDEIDKHGQTLVDIVTKRAQSFAISNPAPNRNAGAGGTNIQQALLNKGGAAGGAGGLDLASTANVPNANQIPSFGPNKAGPFGGMGQGFKASSYPANSIESSLRGTYNPPSIP